MHTHRREGGREGKEREREREGGREGERKREGVFKLRESLGLSFERLISDRTLGLVRIFISSTLLKDTTSETFEDKHRGSERTCLSSCAKARSVLT